MQQALVDCGWHNYSLFYREDGLAVGFFETPIDFETACAEMDDTAINPTWQQAMAKYAPPRSQTCAGTRTIATRPAAQGAGTKNPTHRHHALPACGGRAQPNRLHRARCAAGS